MVSIKEMRKAIDPVLTKITSAPKKAADAEDLSNEFSLTKSYLADCLYDAETTSGAMKGLEKATYADAVDRAGELSDDKGKKLAINAREYKADKDKAYQESLDSRSKAEATVNWIKTHIEIFSEAVVTFRKKAERLAKL
jgi:hypothetical protein